MKKNAILFHYFEHDQSYQDNFTFFLSLAYNCSDDFFIIISGNVSIDLPEKDNIKYIFTENKNYDFGGYSKALRSDVNIADYDAFIFVNSSVRGPFLYSGVDKNWVTLFTHQLDDEVNLIGTSINILEPSSTISQVFKERYGYPEPYSHAQTTSYCLSRKALEYLNSIGLYDVEEELSRIDVISDYEIRLSQELLRAGWQIKCMLPPYNQVDYRSLHEEINASSRDGDPLYKGAYFGRTLSPYELLFIKTNRNLLTDIELASHTYTQLISRKSLLSGWDELDGLLRRSENRMSENARDGEGSFLTNRIRALLRRLS